ncbi:hypothetical protein [Amycolatopsis viridis]|uniref:Uncharacterized protein n=1 Tax=Amycolatopsis viridis TaxID=185678 RepID=A0ABX0SVF0_9PSEU|nr:hypothetical protein [Amycolatopsis viridis]NIH80903.1 hypothetical protein [Amycolatopsis viridis]
MTTPGRTLALLLVSAGVLAGCTGTPAAPAPAPPPPASTPAPDTTAPDTTPPAPAAPSTPAPDPAGAGAGTRAGGCGTVPAASGLTLQVMDTTTSPLSCGQATDLVTRFQQAIAGRQPARSALPVRETVDGWMCVSGPPASQGGTTCSRGEDTVFAQVTESE